MTGRIRYFDFAILMASILAVSISTPSLAQGLVGAERNSFIKASYESCMKGWAANPDSSRLPTDMGGKVCTCSANRLADKTPPSDLKSLNERTVKNPAATVTQLQPLVNEITDYCIDRVISDIEQ
ncbi:hypothetical protein MA20_12395 [Bradyrhizobium japonicum]|uniref:Uncharacterized protein n=1 Tax=Bradyrhizobium japonicum TaxID=375 RepID=A0A0A3Y2N7_BRAJP|nr:hypothetical protein MA20_12395 [Bradyrhizobium japonicum]